MAAIFKRISNLLMIGTVFGSFMFWLLGVNHALTQSFYPQFYRFYLICVGIVLLLNVRKLKIVDWLLLGIAVVVPLFLFISGNPTASVPRDFNYIFFEIISLTVAYRICTFDKYDKWLMGSAIGGMLLLIFYRLIKFLVASGTISMFFTTDNSLKEIWVNVNAIGAGILFGTIALSVLIKESPLKFSWLVNLVLYGFGLFGTWACQSRTSFLILAAFIIIDNLLPKAFLQKYWQWLVIFPLIFIVAPFVFKYLANSADLDLFTGREDIWKGFFESWSKSTDVMRFGQGPYIDQAKNLGIHNSFLSILANFGIVGYIALYGMLTVQVFRTVPRSRKLTKTQVSWLLAFLLTIIYGSMEESMVDVHWVPITYLYLGMALNGLNNKVLGGKDGESPH